MRIKRNGSIVEIDLHGMYEEDAKQLILYTLDHIDTNTTEIVVIHGYQHGQILRDMVRNKLSHPKISCKLLSLNEGKTRILLKKEFKQQHRHI